MSARLDPAERAAALALARRAGRRPVAASQSRRNEPLGEGEVAEIGRRMRQAREALGIAPPYFRTHDGRAGRRSRVEGRDCLNFSSYDYLGLNTDPRTAEAAIRAVRDHGVSATGSPLVAGQRAIHHDLERALASHYGAEAALTFVSGHATNVSVLMALVGPGDAVIHDASIHNSVATGARASGATRLAFAHNDLDALERLLTRHRADMRNILVAVEGLYSMDGDLPDLARLAELRARFGFWLMVDEAHALGVAGPRGEGSFAAAGIDPGLVDIWMGTLSKTLASTGGFIAGSAALVDDLRDRADGYVFSVALPPALAASALAALRILSAEPERVARLRANGQHFLAGARRLGLDCGRAAGLGVLPVILGAAPLAMKASERLLERGINVAPVMFPGVAMDAARLRFFLSSEHEAEDIDWALAELREEIERLAGEGFGRVRA